jgi:hypothetical protein
MEKRWQKYKQYENIAYEKGEIKQKEALLFRWSASRKQNYRL